MTQLQSVMAGKRRSLHRDHRPNQNGDFSLRLPRADRISPWSLKIKRVAAQIVTTIFRDNSSTFYFRRS
jgi:hypothetical protein